MTPELGALFHDIERTLQRAVHDRHHPWRTPVVSTHGVDGPNARTVVLRGYGQGVLRFFTDARSEKVHELAAHPAMHWVFWNPRQQMQLRVSSTVHWLQDHDALAAVWQTVPDRARLDYASLSAPGQKQPEEGHGSTGSGFDLEKARAHFKVGLATVLRVDALHLKREGHVRALFSDFDAQGKPAQADWLVP